MRISSPVFLVLALLGVSRLAFAKSVEIRWAPVDDAAFYELEIHSGKKVEKLKRVPSGKSRLKLSYPTGVYVYRVRAVDEADRPGEWSKPSVFIISAPSPHLKSPVNHSELPEMVLGTALKLEWQKVPGVNMYWVRVRQKDRVWFEGPSYDNSLTIPIRGEGEYQWSVTSVLQPGVALPYELSESQLRGEASKEWSFKAHLKQVELPAVREVSSASPAYENLSALEQLRRNRALVAIYSAVQPYHYEVSNDYAHGSTSANRFLFSAQGDYWVTDQFGVTASLDNYFYELSGHNIDEHDVRIGPTARLDTQSPIGPAIFSPSLSFQMRDAVVGTEYTDSSNNRQLDVSKRSILYFLFSLKWIQQINDSWGVTGEGYYAAPFSAGDAELKGSALAYPNVGIKATVFRKLSDHWMASVALGYEIQQSIVQTTYSGEERVRIPNVTFGASLNYLFY